MSCIFCTCGFLLNSSYLRHLYYFMSGTHIYTCIRATNTWAMTCVCRCSLLKPQQSKKGLESWTPAAKTTLKMSSEGQTLHMLFFPLMLPGQTLPPRVPSSSGAAGRDRHLARQCTSNPTNHWPCQQSWTPVCARHGRVCIFCSLCFVSFSYPRTLACTQFPYFWEIFVSSIWLGLLSLILLMKHGASLARGFLWKEKKSKHEHQHPVLKLYHH